MCCVQRQIAYLLADKKSTLASTLPLRRYKYGVKLVRFPTQAWTLKKGLGTVRVGNKIAGRVDDFMMNSLSRWFYDVIL